MTATFQLSAQDAYVLARTLVGLPWEDCPISPTLDLLLAHLDPNVPDDLRCLRKVLGSELLRAVDSNALPSGRSQQTTDLNIVPVERGWKWGIATPRSSLCCAMICLGVQIRGAIAMCKGELPAGKDITEFYLSGSDIYQWLEQRLQIPIHSCLEKL